MRDNLCKAICSVSSARTSRFFFVPVHGLFTVSALESISLLIDTKGLFAPSSDSGPASSLKERIGGGSGMELIMSGLRRGQVRAFHPRPLHIAKLKECLVLMDWMELGNEAEILGGQGRGRWGGVSCQCEL